MTGTEDTAEAMSAQPARWRLRLVTALLMLSALAAGAVAASPRAETAAATGSAVPAGSCAPSDHPETGLQGRVPPVDRPTGRAALGYSCNLTRIGNLPGSSSFNFDTYRNCGYYTDNAEAAGRGDGAGVVVDLSNPRKPVQTARLTARAMRNAGESLRVNARRGLLVADHYNFPTEVGEIVRTLAVYDVSRDCRKPRLLADVVMPTAVGHEGCFQPDGNVYYMASTETITPIDLTDPRNPRQLSAPWPLGVHGCSLSDDGKTGYFSDSGNGGVWVVDTSQVQARKKGASYKVLSRLATPDNEVQQGTLPLTYGGKPHVFAWAESVNLTTPFRPCLGDGNSNFGYGQMIDVSRRNRPVEVAQLKLESYDVKHCRELQLDRRPQRSAVHQGDAFWPIGGLAFLYDLHQCRPDRLHEPTILACAAWGAGLRVFDIRDPKRMREIAYFNTGTVSAADESLDYAGAHPVIRRDLGQVWWPTLYGGLQVAQFREGVWPFGDDNPCPSASDYYAKQYDLRHDTCSRRPPAQGRPVSTKPVG